MYFCERSDCNTLYLLGRNQLHGILLPLTGFFFRIQSWVRESRVLLVLSGTVGIKRKLLLVIFAHKTQTTIQNNALRLGVSKLSPKSLKQRSDYNGAIRDR